MNERGEEKSVSLTRARSFSVHERTEIEGAAGDKLLMMGNRKEPGFRATNGELTTVRSVERGIINLEDGRSVPANYREFTHGYAVTAHRSQGKTVDQVILSADVMKQELFYVAASRGREGIAIVTSDVERLGQSLGVSMARPSAIELANEISQTKQSLEHHAEMNPKQVIEALSLKLATVTTSRRGRMASGSSCSRPLQMEKRASKARIVVRGGFAQARGRRSIRGLGERLQYRPLSDAGS